MFSKFELFGGAVSVGLMALAIYLVQMESVLFSAGQAGEVDIRQNQPAGIIVANSDDVNKARAEAFIEAVDLKGNLTSMVIDDIKIGTGDEVKSGDTVSVHYVGTLQDGQEFDNSRKRGQTFEFKVGQGQVIKGWDEGVLGMKIGGQRILVIPPDMGYGETGIGPIPGGATLVFAIELFEIK